MPKKEPDVLDNAVSDEKVFPGNDIDIISRDQKEPVDKTKEEPKVPEVTDDHVKEYFKKKYGIEDDPDTIIDGARRIAEENIRQREFLQKIQNQLQNRPRKPVDVDDDDDSLDETQLALQARQDPFGVMRTLFQKQSKTFAKVLAERDRAWERRVNEVTTGREKEANLGNYVRQEWPEAYQPNTELHQEARGIYFNEMTEPERRIPGSFAGAIERAAGRLGLPPKSRRQDKRDTDETLRDVESQTIGRGSKKPAKDEPDEMRLTVKDREYIEKMGLDEKLYKTAKFARKNKRNIRIQDES